MPSAPAKKQAFNSGFLRPKPRMSFRFSLWRFITTTPAMRNNVSLIREWFTICNSVPRTASAFSSPKIPCIPHPIRIKPIWDMDEQASVRFKSTENTARSAPPNIVSRPIPSKSRPQFASCRKILQLTASTPKIPAFVKMPDKRALAGAGATGCAFGSQTCNGNAPAFAPNPTSVQAPAAYKSPFSLQAPAASKSFDISSVPSAW